MSDPHLREPKQRRSRRTLQRITHAALELIAEHGVEGTTVNAIVEGADSSVGSFYARFAGKDDLLAYLDERIWKEAQARWSEATSRGWDHLALPEIVRALARLFGELELLHRPARDALARTLRGPAAGPSESEREFRASVHGDSRRLMLDRLGSIRHPTPVLGVETTCKALEACALSLDSALMDDLCAALVTHLTGAPTSSRPGSGAVEYFDIWG